MSILNINDKKFINCRSIIDYKAKITSIYKDKCFLFIKQIGLNDFRYNSKDFEHIKNFALIKIKLCFFTENLYYYHPKSLIYTSNLNVTLYDIFKEINTKYSHNDRFEKSCYLELTKELVYEL